jgi:hypothetical protein
MRELQPCLLTRHKLKTSTTHRIDNGQLEESIQHAVSIKRRRELDLYKRYAGDPEFKRAFGVSISKLLTTSALTPLFSEK